MASAAPRRLGDGGGGNPIPPTVGGLSRTPLKDPLLNNMKDSGLTHLLSTTYNLRICHRSLAGLFLQELAGENKKRERDSIVHEAGKKTKKQKGIGNVSYRTDWRVDFKMHSMLFTVIILLYCLQNAKDCCNVIKYGLLEWHLCSDSWELKKKPFENTDFPPKSFCHGENVTFVGQKNKPNVDHLQRRALGGR